MGLAIGTSRVGGSAFGGFGVGGSVIGGSVQHPLYEPLRRVLVDLLAGEHGLESRVCRASVGSKGPVGSIGSMGSTGSIRVYLLGL
eukprot:3832336-Rhodomonas_salina.1